MPQMQFVVYRGICMKIKIKNWGPVKEFEYDFSKSVIVTYGDNNIGKSYAMQVVYLSLKHLVAYAKKTVRFPSSSYYFFKDVENGQAPEIQAVVDFAVNKKVQIEDISKKLEEICAGKLAQRLFPAIIDSLNNTFGTFETMLEENPTIEIRTDDKLKCILLFREEKIELQLNRKPTRLRKSLSEFHKSRNGKEQLDIYVYQNHVNAPVELVMQEVANMQKEFCIEILRRIKNVYFLPASRSGIYAGMSSFGPILAQLSQNRAYIKGTIQIPSISEPISDYYMMLSEIRGDILGHFSECAEEIEKSVLKGDVLYDKKSKAIVYKPFGSQLQLEMRDTSSMVSEISPITAFLKYVVEKGIDVRVRRAIGSEDKPQSVIFIEEPEAHLHPSNQVSLIKAFVKLAEQDVTLVMASHSNYIFNQLNNLVLGKALKSEDYSPILLRKKGTRSYSSYMNIDELGADDENFADISEQLMEEREELLDILMREEWEKEQSDDPND